MNLPHDSLDLPRALADGLVLRLAGSTDIDAMAEFNGRLLADEDESPELLELWTRDLMSGQHPTMTAADVILVEDTKTNAIVSATCLIPQVWSYGGIPFPVGRPELVATDKAYRRRGLVRTVFEAVHALSAAYGHMVQGITGISWFYRQFGYEYALALGGRRELSITKIGELKEGEQESYQIRAAVETDIPILMRLDEHQSRGKLVTAVRDETRWRYDLSGRSQGSVVSNRIFSICTPEGHMVGYYSIPNQLWGSHLAVFEVVIDAGVVWPEVLPAITRALKKQGETYAAKAADTKTELAGIRFSLGLEHPIYEILDGRLAAFQPPYSWYIRVPDVPGFVRHIAPALEARLENSSMRGFSGKLNIDFYRDGLELKIEQGKLAESTPWNAPDTDQQFKGAAFPPLVFLQLLFGYRSLAELRGAFPDCRADEEATLLLNTLFPKQTSRVLGLE